MQYVNGAPAHYANGTADGSAVKLFPAEKKTVHCQPLFFLNTPKGMYDEMDVVGGEFNATYGIDAVNPLSKFFNHQSLLALDAIGLACQATVMRAEYVPVDPEVNPSNGIANITIFLTKTESDLADSYPILRDDNGMGIWENGEWKVDDTVADEDKVKAQYYQMTARFVSDEELATLTSKTYTDSITKGDETVDGKVIPIMTIPAVAHGSYYNNVGVKLYPLVGEDADVDMMTDARNMGFFIGLVDKESGKEVIIKTRDAGEGYKVTFDPNATHPVTGQTTTLEDIFAKKFSNLTNPDYEFSAPIISDVIYHRTQFKQLFEDILTFEAENFDGTILPWSDFTEFESEEAIAEAKAVPYILNFLDCRYSSGAPMENTRRSDNLVLNDEISAYSGPQVNFTKDTSLFLQGGEDGQNIVDNPETYKVAHEEDLLRRLAKYADQDAAQTHLALSTISEFVDTGYSLDTKMKLGIFNSYRTDVRLIASTYEVNIDNKDMTTEEHISVGALLEAMLAMSIESAEYNTPTVRTAIVIGSGLEKRGFFRYRVPLSYDFALKNIKMFRGSKWNTTYEFSCDEGNIVEYLVDVTPRYMPRSLKTKAWDAGIIWVDAADKLNVRYPQMQTIYPDDTSVLNGWYTAVAICYIEKMLDEAHRERQGDMTSTPTQQVDKMNEKITTKLNDKFGNIIIPAVDVFKTPRDMSAGYAVTANVKMFAPNMFTVLTSGILALRKV